MEEFSLVSKRNKLQQNQNNILIECGCFRCQLKWFRFYSNSNNCFGTVFSELYFMECLPESFILKLCGFCFALLAYSAVCVNLIVIYSSSRSSSNTRNALVFKLKTCKWNQFAGKKFYRKLLIFFHYFTLCFYTFLLLAELFKVN